MDNIQKLKFLLQAYSSVLTIIENVNLSPNFLSISPSAKLTGPPPTSWKKTGRRPMFPMFLSYSALYKLAADSTAAHPYTDSTQVGLWDRNAEIK
jgi:hypothetical protein